MSYDFRIIYKKSKKTFSTDKYCPMRYYGGTIRVEPDTILNGDPVPVEITDFDFNMTYNYGVLLRKCGMEESIRTLYDKDLSDCIKILESTIKTLKEKYSDIWNKDIRGADPKKKSKHPLIGLTYDIPEKAPSKKDILKQNDILDDYWAVTPSNVYKQLQHILDCLYWIKCTYSAKIFNSLTFTGD